mmetsp:Transcript_14346/g.17063  ORF Transcript_14346/g.17063 Transcript_14346/m.17063 type:complete len:310 (-) Transcript_14346:104-1033(-)
MSNITYSVEYAKSGRSTCKKSKEKIPQGAMRIGKIQPSPFDPEATMASWFLPGPFFEMMRKMRKDSKKVETIEDLDGYTELKEEDQNELTARILSFWDTTVTVTKKKPTPKKRVIKDEDEEDVKVSPPKKAKAVPKKVNKNDPHASDVVPCSNSDLKGLAASLLVKARQDGIKMPTDDVIGRQAAGTALVQAWDRGNGTVDLGTCMDTLEGTHGTTRGAKVIYVVCEENRPLALAFKELSDFQFKSKNAMKGIALNKVFRAISNLEVPLKNGKQAAKIEGIGKSSASKVDEFLMSGTIHELETFRSGTI